MPDILYDDVYVEQLHNDNDDIEVDIPNIGKVAAQEVVIIEDDDGGGVNLDLTPDNVLPEGSSRGRIPQRRLSEEGYQLANVVENVNDTPPETN